MKYFKNKFKDRLRELRIEKGISQSELGKELNLTQSTIAKWESGEHEPDINTLMAIATFFGESIDYLVGFVD